MEEKLLALIRLARNRRASDIHFIRRGNSLEISLRQPDGLVQLEQDIFEISLLEYL